MDPAHRNIAKLYPSQDVMTISNQDNTLVVYVVNVSLREKINIFTGEGRLG
jgi:hypothetical protein